MTDDFWAGAKIIHAYTRSQAIEDGVLVDVTSIAREAGIVFPVALTQRVWADCVAWDEEDSLRQVPQNQSGRLWDVLWMTRWAIVRNRQAGGRRVPVELLRVARDGRSTTATPVRLEAVCGPGDNAEPVITVMFPGED